jgi:hypothetical protein
VSNQNKYSLITLRTPINVALSLAIIFVPLAAKAQIPVEFTQNQNKHKYSYSLSSVQNINLTECKQDFLLIDEVFCTVKSQEESKKPQEEPLDFSSSGRSGQQTAGESRGSCPQVNVPLTAIAPKSNVSKTITSHPRWWFFLPYQSSQISHMEFVLQDEARNDLVRNTISVPETLPYLSTTIPSTHPGIKPNRWYRWYLKVYCVGKKDTVPLYVSGWVQKIQTDVSDEGLVVKHTLTAVDYAQRNLWLDAINLLMKTQISEVSAPYTSQMWQKIMSSPEINLELPQPAKANIVIK